MSCKTQTYLKSHPGQLPNYLFMKMNPFEWKGIVGGLAGFGIATTVSSVIPALYGKGRYQQGSYSELLYKPGNFFLSGS